MLVKLGPKTQKPKSKTKSSNEQLETVQTDINTDMKTYSAESYSSG